MFYWTLANIDPELRSSLDAIQLIGIAQSRIVKKYGLKKALKPFFDEIQVLESDGVTIYVDGNERTYKGTLMFMAADTPAAAEMGGFKQSVSAHCPCRHCMSTHDELKLFYNERYFVLRNKHSHAQHVAAVTEPNVPKRVIKHWAREYGVMSDGIFGKLQYFDVTKCLPQDAMHVLIEGVLEVEMRALLRFFIVELNAFTIEDVNDRISNFEFDYFNDNKPATMLRDHIERDSILKQSASQLFNLGHCLPFLLDEWIFDSRESVTSRVSLHADLLQILNVVLAYEISLESVDILERMIEIFCLRFETLYPETSVPKFHFLIHIPGGILLFGPSRQQWCLRFEGAHNYYKSLIPVVRSFKNLPLTLSYRHQARAASRMGSADGTGTKNFLYQGDDISLGQSVLLMNLPNCDLLRNFVPPNYFNDEIKVMRTPKVVRYGTEYKPKNVILIECSTDSVPVFGKIKELFQVHQEIVLTYTILNVQYYCKELNAYCVKDDPGFIENAIMLKDLEFPHPIPKLTSSSSLFVLLLNHEFTEFYG